MLNHEHLSQLRASLFAGHYNLLLGSGVSIDSTGTGKKPLQAASDLTAALCDLKKVSARTPLSRVSLLLTPEETEQYLTIPFSNCKPGETVKRITGFVWKSIFTFNIDDALEAAYESTSRRRQRAESVNYDENYRTTSNRGHVPIVHLHGFVREPEKKYVFSVSEYARVTRGLNPWMHVLSELLASEPFIVAGTSLNESDLDYYLTERTDTSLRTNRGPSILVEPFPDAITESLCARHGFVLVKATFSSFLNWLVQNIGHPPSVEQLTVPSIEGLFTRSFGPDGQLEFFSSFEFVKPVGPNPVGEPSPFFYGRAPRWSDLESSLDLPTDDERRLSASVRNHLEGDAHRTKLFVLLAESGSGKTTTIRRVAYDLAREGRIVLNLTGKLALDAVNTRLALSCLTKAAAIFIDNVADHASSLRATLADLNLTKPIAVVCADRDYRRDHVDRLLGDLALDYFSINPWNVGLLQDLIEKFRRAGLVGSAEALRLPAKFAQMLVDEPIAIAGCRILNNFKPLDVIVHSLWQDASPSDQNSYAIAALAEFCYSGGILYPILERAQSNTGLRDQLSLAVPLPLAFSEDGDYVLPLHPAVGERLLGYLARDKGPLILELFKNLANALAPYVNRRTIIDRTPEARLSGRLFNADRVVKPLLRDRSKEFYQQVQEGWQWNSRYWEQRAILTQQTDIDGAIQFARHAVAIEEHPFPQTTLASLLVRKMELTAGPAEMLFEEVCVLLGSALRDEAKRGWRPTPHPYSALFHGANVYLRAGGRLSPKQDDWIRDQIEYCARHFSRDATLLNSGRRITDRLRKS